MITTDKARRWFFATHPDAKRDYEMRKLDERLKLLDWALKHRGDAIAEAWLREFYPRIAAAAQNRKS